MDGYSIILNEGDTADLILNWTDYAGATFLASGWYKILDVGTMDDILTHGIVKDTTSFTETLTITIPLTKAEVKIVTAGNILEKKVIMLSLTYSATKHKNEEYEFYVRKLDFITADGVV